MLAKRHTEFTTWTFLKEIRSLGSITWLDEVSIIAAAVVGNESILKTRKHLKTPCDEAQGCRFASSWTSNYSKGVLICGSTCPLQLYRKLSERNAAAWSVVSDIHFTQYASWNTDKNVCGRRNIQPFRRLTLTHSHPPSYVLNFEPKYLVRKWSNFCHQHSTLFRNGCALKGELFWHCISIAKSQGTSLLI